MQGIARISAREESEIGRGDIALARRAAKPADYLDCARLIRRTVLVDHAVQCLEHNHVGGDRHACEGLVPPRARRQQRVEDYDHWIESWRYSINQSAKGCPDGDRVGLQSFLRTAVSLPRDEPSCILVPVAV